MAGPFFLLIGTHPGFGRVVALRWVEMLIGVLLKQAAVALVLSVLLYCYALIMGTSDAVLPWALKILMIALVTVAAFIYRKPFTHLFSAVGYGVIGARERADADLARAGSTLRNNTRSAATLAVPGFAAYRAARWARQNPAQAAALATSAATAAGAGVGAAGRAAGGMAANGADAESAESYSLPEDQTAAAAAAAAEGGAPGRVGTAARARAWPTATPTTPRAGRRRRRSTCRPATAPGRRCRRGSAPAARSENGAATAGRSAPRLPTSASGPAAGPASARSAGAGSANGAAPAGGGVWPGRPATRHGDVCARVRAAPGGFVLGPVGPGRPGGSVRSVQGAVGTAPGRAPAVRGRWPGLAVDIGSARAAAFRSACATTLRSARAAGCRAPGVIAAARWACARRAPGSGPAIHPAPAGACAAAGGSAPPGPPGPARRPAPEPQRPARPAAAPALR